MAKRKTRMTFDRDFKLPMEVVRSRMSINESAQRAQRSLNFETVYEALPSLSTFFNSVSDEWTMMMHDYMVERNRRVTAHMTAVRNNYPAPAAMGPQTQASVVRPDCGHVAYRPGCPGRQCSEYRRTHGPLGREGYHMHHWPEYRSVPLPPPQPRFYTGRSWFDDAVAAPYAGQPRVTAQSTVSARLDAAATEQERQNARYMQLAMYADIIEDGRGNE